MPSITVTIDYPTPLPSGLTWSAQEKDAAGANVGSAITSGFSGPDASGDYAWTGTVTQTAVGKVRFTASNGRVIDLPFPLSASTSSGGDEWYYADTQAVEDLIGTDNMDIVFDADGDGTIDDGAVVRAGTFTDGYIDVKLRAAGLDAPNDLADTGIAAVIKSASAHLAAWYGFHQRGLRDAASNQTATAMSGIMEGYKTFADELIAGVVGVLEAEDDDPTTSPPGGFGFVPIVRDDVLSATDENGY